MSNEVLKQTGKIHLPQLDGIKGIICFFIIFVHYYNRTPSHNFPIHWIPDMLVEKGWMFVEFFFIISGFLFALTNKQKIQNTEFGVYIKQRLKRLYPSALLITAADILIRLIDVCVNGGGTRMTVAGILRTLTFAETWIYNGEPFPTVLWYIHVLLLCYVVYYLIGKSKSASTYMLGVVGMLLFGWLLYVMEWDIPFLYRNIGRGYLAFAVGLLVYEFQTRASKKVRLWSSMAALILALVTLGLGVFFSYEQVFGDVLLSCTLFLFPVTMLCLLNIPIVGRVLAGRPLVWLGKRSLALFLVHVPVMNLIQAIFYRSGLMPFDKVGSFVVVLLVIFGAAILWHHFIEKRLIPVLLQAMKEKQVDRKDEVHEQK